MNKKSIILSFLFFIIIATLSSCKKDNTETPTTPLKKISALFMSDDNPQYYEYNSDGKLSKIIHGSITMTFTYTANTVIILYGQGRDTLFLNSQGYVSKATGNYTFNTKSSSNNVKGNVYFGYEYDNNGYCTKKTYGTTVTNYTYKNGNLSSESQGSDVRTYEYYLDKDNTIGNEYVGMSFYGKCSKNLRKQQIISPLNSPSYLVNYTYEFDQDNYVTKQITGSSWLSFTYK